MRGEQTNDVLHALRDGRRRAVLRLLRNRTEPISEEEVAIHLAAADAEKRLLDVTEGELAEWRVSLQQTHLPVLEEAGLIDWGGETNAVAVSTHPALQSPTLERILETDRVDWDEILGALVHRRRRIALSVLADYDTALSRVALARAVVEREPGTETVETADADPVENCCAALHHVHLPKLAAAGLASYDARSGAVSYCGHPLIEDTEWFDLHLPEAPRAVLSVAEPSQDIWRLDGRANVIEHCRALCEYADDELFLLYTDEDLIEAACLRCLQDAVDRGVDVYVGTQTPAIRDRVREQVPGVTLWEPQRDWMNISPEREKVGRLLFADREAIMLGTLSKHNDHGIQNETAITGAGEDNALVMLVRELLGSRLDHLDEQSADFLEEIPF
ncbi:DUF7344 domain-containing protein [Natronococcus roseus]|uniref:DUF7344 domain-containing protein n=1 Tax=Natronococcus roseus TaxID=1052014 RepID=UPI00374DEF54